VVAAWVVVDVGLGAGGAVFLALVVVVDGGRDVVVVVGGSDVVVVGSTDVVVSSTSAVVDVEASAAPPVRRMAGSLLRWGTPAMATPTAAHTTSMTAVIDRCPGLTAPPSRHDRRRPPGAGGGPPA
jgi:hypothetical protein